MTICKNCNYCDPDSSDRCPSCNFLHAPAATTETPEEVAAELKVDALEAALDQAKEEAAAVAEVHAPPVAIVDHPSEVEPTPGEPVTTQPATTTAELLQRNNS